jgi:hypothetical protein
MPNHYSFSYGVQAQEPQFALRGNGVPGGVHVTFTFKSGDVTPEQYEAMIRGDKLQDIPDFSSINFTRFNVTEEENRKHFYFSEDGKIIWMGTNKEATTAHPKWSQAIDAALVVYNLIGVSVTKMALINQLYNTHGRSRLNPVDPVLEEAELKKTMEKNAARPLMRPRQVKASTSNKTQDPGLVGVTKRTSAITEAREKQKEQKKEAEKTPIEKLYG